MKEKELIQIKHLVLWDNMENIIYYDGRVAYRIGLGMNAYKVLELMGVLESKLQSGDFVHKELQKKVEHVLSRFESFVHEPQGDQIKGKAEVFEEDSEENPENIILERFFELLEEEIPMAKDGALPMVKEAVEQPQERLTLFLNKVINDEENNNKIMLEIATKLYDKYHHDPTLLESVGALFSLKHTVKEWQDCCDTVLASVRDAAKTNLFNLKLSCYEKLQTDIQLCVRYCSLFPKDYMFNKNNLIHLWASQEQFLTVAANRDSVGHEYFEKLLEEGYFIEVNQGEGTGDIVGYKMHYLVNEFLKEIAKPEFCLFDESHGEINVTDILHLSFVVDSSWILPPWMLTIEKLQSLLFLPRKFYEDFVEVPDMNKIITNNTCLQALDLVVVNCENIWDSVRAMKDLRYLRLGISRKKLPGSIIELKNLQTLDLRLSNVMELPREFYILKHLRHLYVGSTLIELPRQISKLECLTLLDVFVVGENNNLDALRSLKLAGELTIRFNKRCNNIEALKDKSQITELSLVWSTSYGRQSTFDDMHHFLQPLPNLRSLVIRGWKGGRFKNFPILESLVSICMEDCGCKYLPNLSSLRYLRSLQLSDFKSLEYIDNCDDISEDLDSYFPSLKYVMLANLHELKGWSSRIKEEEILVNCVQIRIKGCPKMVSMARIPNLETLDTHNINEKLLRYILWTTFEAQNACFNWWRRVPIPPFKSQKSTYSGRFWLKPTSTTQSPLIKLQNLEIVSINDLDSTFSISGIPKSLTIKRCSKLKKLEFKPGMNLLQQLVIHDCNALKDISSALQFYSLERLEIKGCEKLNLGDDNMKVVWEGLNHLKYLNLVGISNLTSLENSLVALKNLEVLSLKSFYDVKALPEWIGKLTSLRHLSIKNFPYLITLPESLGDLFALQSLEIQCCPLLKPFPNSLCPLKYLKKLSVEQCPKLFKSWKTNGEDSTLLKNIPNLVFI